MSTNKLIRIRPISATTNVSEAGTGLLSKATVTVSGLISAAGVASRGEIVYVSDSENHIIFKIRRGQPSCVFVGTAGVSGLTDGQGGSAKFNQPGSICIDSAGTLWVVDVGNQRIRKVTENGNVYTVADITGTTPTGISVDEAGNIFLLDTTED